MFEAPWVNGGYENSKPYNENENPDVLVFEHYHDLPIIIRNEDVFWQLENIRGEGEGEYIHENLWRYENSNGVVYGRPTREPGVWQYERENPMTHYPHK